MCVLLWHVMAHVTMLVLTTSIQCALYQKHGLERTDALLLLTATAAGDAHWMMMAIDLLPLCLLFRFGPKLLLLV